MSIYLISNFATKIIIQSKFAIRHRFISINFAIYQKTGNKLWINKLYYREFLLFDFLYK